MKNVTHREEKRVWLRVRFAVVLAVAIGALAVGWRLAIRYVFSPRLYIEDQVIDFGDIPGGTRVTRTIEVHNRGGALLEITDLRTGCGCTEVAIAGRQIAANGSTQLHITQEVDSLSSVSQTDLFLFSNDPRVPVYQLPIRYGVSRDPFLEPSQVDFGRVGRLELPSTRKCRILDPRSEAPLVAPNRITASVDVSFLRTAIKKPTHGSNLEIHVVLEKDAPLGELWYRLRIANTESNRVFETSIIGNVQGWCFALPQALDLGKISRNDEKVTKIVEFKNRDEASSVIIQEIQISETLKGLLTIESFQDRDSASVSVGVSPREYSGVWSNQQHRGYFKTLCTDAQGNENWIAVPVRFHAVAAKVRDKRSR